MSQPLFCDPEPLLPLPELSSWITLMRQSPASKRARRLLRELKGLQDEDYSITPSTLFAIKYLLQLHNRCRFIEVKIDSLAANNSVVFHRFILPKFIVSQLEEQKLTDRDS